MSQEKSHPIRMKILPMLLGKFVSNVAKQRKLPMGHGLIVNGMFQVFIPIVSSFRRFRELLWQYFLPTLHEDSPVTPEPAIGHTRIFKSVRFKLALECSTSLDFYFMNKTVRNTTSFLRRWSFCFFLLETPSTSCRMSY